MRALRNCALAIAAILLTVLPAQAAGQVIRINTWDQWGTTLPTAQMASSIGNPGGSASPLPFGIVTSSSNFALHSISAPPWNPSGNGTYLEITGTGSPSPNPGAGFYDTLPGMYGSLILCGWVRWISGIFFMFRMNDSHAGQVFGTDNTQISIQGSAPSSGQMQFMDFQTSPATIATNTWYAYEWFQQPGTASGHPQGEYTFKLYSVSGTLLWTVSNLNFNNNQNSYNDDSITLDCELGGSTPLVDFGPYYVIDPQGNGASAMIGPQAFATFYPTADSTPLQFTPSSAGSHYSLVGVNLPNSAYVQDATQGQQDTYKFAAATTGIATFESWAQGTATAAGGRNFASVVSNAFSATGVSHGAPFGTNAIDLDILGTATGSNIQMNAGPEVAW